MTADELGQRLHDRATRGEPLSESERRMLEQWYARHDREEQVILNGTANDEKLKQLQNDVDSTLERIVKVSQEIRSLAADNEALRGEIRDLHQQLVKKSSTQPA